MTMRMPDLLAPARPLAARRATKSAEAFRTISEVADDLDVPQHVLRFWESRFPQIKPLKRAGGRRYYRPDDVTLLRRIRQCLYEQGYTIKGVQKLLREGGLRPAEAAPRSAEAMSSTIAQLTFAAPRPVRTEAQRRVLLELRHELTELRDMLRRIGR
jgi:DNA-binding transcriptional MerR regulator